MRTQLTIEIDHTIAQQADAYAKRHHTSIDELLANYLAHIIHEKPPTDAPVTAQMAGMFQADDDGQDYKAMLAQARC